MNLPHALDRTLLVRARRTTVFSFFLDNDRFAAWWGKGSTIDARPGGTVRICYPGGVVASGRVEAVERGSRIVFTYGYEGEGKPIAPGGSRVTVTFADDPHGTLVSLRHEVADAAVRDQHVQGWRHQLSVFAHVAAEVEHAGAAALVDDWFAAWNEPDAAARARLLDRCCTDDVTFRNAWAALANKAEILPHIAAALQFMPGIRLERHGPVRHCQGTALADWRMQKGDATVGAGTNVFELASDGRIRAAVGIAAPPAAAIDGAR